MKVVLSGYGKMGHMIEDVCLRQGIEVAACSEDITSIDPELARQSVCIDFTTPQAFRSNYPWLAEHFKAVVVGTTGWNDIAPDVFSAFEKAGCPMVHSANYSIGVNAVFAALERVSAILAGNGYVPHIEETHHIHKLDAPSGTAKTMAEIVKDNLGICPDITSIREGEVPGTHVVKFKSSVDKIKISHEAFSREGFAQGAVAAAKIADTLESGIHEFKDLIL